jgi:uncharacterized protein
LEEIVAEHPNVTFMRELTDAFTRSDMAAIHTAFADNITWHVAGRGPMAGDYKGKDQVFGLFGKLLQLSGGALQLEVHDILANDDHAVMLSTTTASRAGKTLTYRRSVTAHVEDGRLTEVWEVFDPPYETDEFWSQEA